MSGVYVGFRLLHICIKHLPIKFERINQRNPTIKDAQPNLRFNRPPHKSVIIRIIAFQAKEKEIES